MSDVTSFLISGLERRAFLLFMHNPLVKSLQVGNYNMLKGCEENSKKCKEISAAKF